MKNCSKPIETSLLVDYWLALLSGSDEQAVEEHLLACDACGDRLREVIALAEGIRALAREGSLRMIVSDEYLKRAATEGRHVRQYSVPAGGSVNCTVTAGDDILIARLAANLSVADRVDLSMCDESGVEQVRLRDIPVRSGADSVILQESITFAKGAPSHKMIARLVALDDSGHESLLGEYTFNHTRSLPGPGNWQS
jgi:hypothetical protein